MVGAAEPALKCTPGIAAGYGWAGQWYIPGMFAFGPAPSSRLLALLAIVSGVAGLSGIRAAETVTPPAIAPAADRERIDAWVEQLAAAQFSQREAATRQLAAAGAAAIEPLRKACGRGDLEVASRAVEILREMLSGTDADLAREAERTLESLAEEGESSVAGLAEATLDFHTLGMAEAARAKLESLGAVVTEGLAFTGQRGLHVLFNASWTGTAEDLRLLARLRHVTQVSVHGVRLDEASLAVLGRMRGLEHLQLFGTGVAEGPLAALAEKLPQARIDVRKGGKLGVAGQPAIGPCLITHVQDGSAAAKAGIQIGDVVVGIDGHPVANFEALTELVGRQGPGAKIELEIERGGINVGNPGGQPQRLKRTVELGGWD
jgi:hypothetical protein